MECNGYGVFVGNACKHMFWGSAEFPVGRFGDIMNGHCAAEPVQASKEEGALGSIVFLRSEVSRHLPRSVAEVKEIYCKVAGWMNPLALDCVPGASYLNGVFVEVELRLHQRAELVLI